MVVTWVRLTMKAETSSDRVGLRVGADAVAVVQHASTRSLRSENFV
jgi:hypothetical protein